MICLVDDKDAMANILSIEEFVKVRYQVSQFLCPVLEWHQNGQRMGGRKGSFRFTSVKALWVRMLIGSSIVNNSDVFFWLEATGMDYLR